MANNFTQFSECVVCNSEEEANWLLNALKTHESDECGQPCEVCLQPGDPKAVAIYSEETCDLEVLCDILCGFQKKFPSDKAIIVSYAFTCSRPIVEEFGGGAMVIYGGKDKWIDARMEANKYVERLAKKKKK